jgi:type VI secretion system protein VasD
VPPPPPLPPTLELGITAGADQNPDPTGQPTPVAIRVFQLTGTGRFENADPFALAGDPQKALDDEMIGSEEFIVRPGEMLRIERPVKPGAQFAGIVVLFRDIDNARWRAVAKLEPHGPTRLAVRTERLSVVVAGPGDDAMVPRAGSLPQGIKGEERAPR